MAVKTSRAAHRDKPYRDLARENIQIGVCLSIIDKVDKKLMAEHERMDLATVPALKLLCENQWRKLAKVLPDLKAVELTGKDGGPLGVEIVRYTAPP